MTSLSLRRCVGLAIVVVVSFTAACSSSTSHRVAGLIGTSSGGCGVNLVGHPYGSIVVTNSGPASVSQTVDMTIRIASIGLRRSLGKSVTVGPSGSNLVPFVLDQVTVRRGTRVTCDFQTR